MSEPEGRERSGERKVLCGWLPRCKHNLTFGGWVGCSRLSGLLMQSVGTAGPDGVREPGPDRLLRL